MRWTREELLVVLNFYFKIPFGKVSSKQPAVVDLAKKLSRTPGSISMKVGNFASFDPAHQIRGVGGLSGASRLDREVWEEFHRNPAEIAPLGQQLFDDLFVEEPGDTVEVIPGEGVRCRRATPPADGSTETVALGKRRRGQAFFREMVINNYGGRCAITGLPIRELLVASHILPWAGHERERLNVRNGISLNRLHDAAFDSGLIGFDDSLRLCFSDRLRTFSQIGAVRHHFYEYESAALDLPPDSIPPDPVFLAQHRKRFGIR
jgi:putative restriction endonuclease